MDKMHGYRLSAYARNPVDFYPTPSELADGLARGLPEIGLELPQAVLDPCGGDGALRRSLGALGADVKLTDLYPERYPNSDGYVTREPLDATDPNHLNRALELSNASAIVTNTPHNTKEACAIARNTIELVEEGRINFAAALFRAIWSAEPGRIRFFNRPSFRGEILCCWRARWIAESVGSPMHAYAWYIWGKAPRVGPPSKVYIERASCKKSDESDRVKLWYL
jgi:hypothetical protein